MAPFGLCHNPGMTQHAGSWAASMSDAATEFFDLHRHGFVRVAVAVLRCCVADPAFNAGETIAPRTGSRGRTGEFGRLPELGLSAYTCDDLFHQHALLVRTRARPRWTARRPRRRTSSRGDRDRRPAAASTSQTAVQLRRGRRAATSAAMLGVAEELGTAGYLPNYGEFYEVRSSTRPRTPPSIRSNCAAERVPFGAGLRCSTRGRPRGRHPVHAEICEDVWRRAGADPAVVRTPRRGRRRAAAVSSTCRRRTSPLGKSAATATTSSQSQSARCLAAFVGGPGRVDDRPGVGRPGAGIRERHAARRVGALRTDRTWSPPTSTSNAWARAHAPDASARRARHRAEIERLRTLRFELWGARHAPAAPHRALPFTCLPTRRGATSAATRSTTSRSRRSCSGCRRAASRRLVIGVSGGLDSTHAAARLRPGDGPPGPPRSDIPASRCRLRHDARARSTRRCA